MAIGEDKTEVTRSGRSQGRLGNASVNSVRCGTPAIQEVSQSLNDHSIAEEIGKSGDIPPIPNRIAEGFGERVGDQDSKIGIVGFLLGITMAIDRNYVIDVLIFVL